MTIEERFEKIEKKNEDLDRKNESLEKQNRKLRRLSLVSIALALAGFVGGTALSVRAYTGVIEPLGVITQSISLKDVSGRLRLSLSGPSGQAGLVDGNGKTRVLLSTGGIVSARDSNGVTRVALNGSDGKVYFYNASAQLVKTLP